MTSHHCTCHDVTPRARSQVNEEEQQEGEEGKNEEDDLGISAEEIARMDWEESFNSHHDSNPRLVKYSETYHRTKSYSHD